MDIVLLTKAIQTRIDDVNTDVAIDVVTNPLIEEILNQQLANIFKILPLNKLPNKPFDATITPVQDKLYSVELPNDFLRLVRFKTDILNRPLMETDLVQEGDIKYMQMFQPWISGGDVKLRGCIIKDTTKKLLFNASSAGTIENAIYVSTPTTADVTDEILDPVAWYIASVALQIVGEQNASVTAVAKVTEYINNKN